MRSRVVIWAVLLLGAAAAWAAGDRSEGPAGGEARVVTGTVRRASADGNAVTLAFDDDPTSVRVILLRGWVDDFPHDPVRYYLGKTVQVHGSVTYFKDTPEIIVRDADDLVVVGQAKPAAPVGAPLPDEVKALRERLRLLEERVRELERHEAARKDSQS